MPVVCSKVYEDFSASDSRSLKQKNPAKMELELKTQHLFSSTKSEPRET